MGERAPVADAGPIVFFDGVCGLCNRFVDFLLKHDKKARLRFAPLQGATAERLLGPLAGDMPSVVFVSGTQVRRRSAAVAGILATLGGPWVAAAAALRLLPRPVADQGYDLVASRRYQLFGKKPACRLPTAAERGRFLP